MKSLNTRTSSREVSCLVDWLVDVSLMQMYVHLFGGHFLQSIHLFVLAVVADNLSN